MSVPPVTCVSRTLELISIENQYITEVHGGGGGGRMFNGHGQVVVSPVSSTTEQIQTVWFRTRSGKEKSRTVHDANLQGREGHVFQEIEIRSPGKPSKLYRYHNVTTGTDFPVFDPYSLALQWRVVQHPWEAGGGTALVGAILGFFVFGIIAGSMFDNGSKGAGLFVGLIVNPLVGAVLFSTMIQNFINKKRFKVYQDFEAAVNDALRNIAREV